MLSQETRTQTRQQRCSCFPILVHSLIFPHLVIPTCDHLCRLQIKALSGLWTVTEIKRGTCLWLHSNHYMIEDCFQPIFRATHTQHKNEVLLLWYCNLFSHYRYSNSLVFGTDFLYNEWIINGVLGKSSFHVILHIKEMKKCSIYCWINWEQRVLYHRMQWIGEKCSSPHMSTNTILLIYVHGDQLLSCSVGVVAG